MSTAGGFRAYMQPARVPRCWHMMRATTLPGYRFPPAHSSDDRQVSMPRDETQLLERVIEVVTKKMPDLAEHYLRVPLSYYTDEKVAARERHLFMTQPIAL